MKNKIKGRTLRLLKRWFRKRKHHKEFFIFKRNLVVGSKLASKTTQENQSSVDKCNRILPMYQ